jgi:hypothetical protein
MAMVDGGPDDLPRTFRRERDAQREAREREARERAAVDQAFAPPPASMYPQEAPIAPDYAASYPPPMTTGVVTALEIPFGRLVAFFLKALFAALPAIILLGIMLWGMGQLLTMYFPALLKMKILITFPN